MKKTPFDYIDLHCNKFYEMKMRVVRFPISKDSYECIITNLTETELAQITSMDGFPLDAMKELDNI